MHQHHRLHRSRLVRLLQQWTQVQAAPVRADRADLAEQLSQWLSTVDAVKLGRWLHQLESADGFDGDAADPASAPDVPALQAGLDAARAELSALVVAPPTRARPLRERADHTPVPGPDPEMEADFATHAARYLATQKQMEMRLATLRGEMRQHLAGGPAALRRLAALDAAMEQMLAAREQKLWASLPGHLERRMAHRRMRYQQQLEAVGQDDDPQRWRAPGGWLHGFEQDLRALLQAELEVRLQPLAGLLEAAQAWQAAPEGPGQPLGAGDETATETVTDW